MSLGNVFGGLFGASSLVSGIGTGVQAVGAYQEAKAANAAAEYNAQIEDQNASYYSLMGENALARADKEAGDHRRGIEKLKGEQRAGYAAAGVKVDTGSALDVAADTAKWGEYDAQTIMYNGAVEKAGYDQKAYNSSASAAMLRNTRRSPSLAAGGVVLNGLAKYSQYGDW